MKNPTDPMSAAQAELLKRLCEDHGHPYWPGATRQLAWGMIAALSPKRRPLTRADVRAVPCPDCHAPAGERCATETGAKRTGNHQARVKASRLALLENP